MNQITIIPHTLNGVCVDQRASDGFMNATAMCKAAGKRWDHYNTNETTKDFLEALSSDTGIPASQLVISKRGNSANFQQGTWIHPKVAIHLAQWLSPRFAVQVTNWVYDWMSGGMSFGQIDDIKRSIDSLQRATMLTVRSLEDKDLEVQELRREITDMRKAHDARIAVSAHVSVKQLLEEHGAIQKGRHGINRKVGCRMRNAATLRGIVLLKCPHSGVWLFPRDFAAQYMRDEGRALVADHNAKQTGQTVMHFGPRRKGRKPGLSVVGKGETTGKGEPA